MTARALLIGSETYGLSGCNADVALMAETLGARGFTAIDVRTGSAATRAGIIAGLQALLAAVDPGDAVVVYYSGHGGRVARPDFEQRKAAGLSPHFQFIVPFDMEDTTAGDFRGLLSEELTTYQRALTEAFVGLTPNVTTILDCCHSGYLARDIEARPKAVDLEPKMFRIKGIREHAQALGAAAALGGLSTNPDAVRLVACAPEQSAFELPSAAGGRHGALTEALAGVLAAAGTTKLPWSLLADLVRRRVRALVPEQRPELEGPAERVAFSPEALPAAGALPVAMVDGQPRIEAAALLGIDAGDIFDVVVPGQEAAGTATVEAVVGGDGLLRASSSDAAAALAASGYLLPRRISVPRLKIRLDVDAAATTTLAADIDVTTRLSVGGSDPIAVVTADPGGFGLLDRTGARWRTATYSSDAGGRYALMQELERIAVGHRLLDLPSGEGSSALPAVVEITFATVQPPPRREAARHGERLVAGTKVALRLRNTSAEPLFVWVFDVGVSGRSSLVTNAAPSGTLLGAAGAEDDTVDVWGPAGESLFWPPDVPAENTPRQETFVVLTADRRSDLSSLASAASTARGEPLSALDAVLAEARTGVREVPAASSAGPPLRYRLDAVEFFLTARSIGAPS